MIHSFLAIFRNAFDEVVRQPIYAILIVAGLALIALSPVITAFTMMEDVKLTVDMGLGTIFMVGIILSVLGATQVISDEIESKTAGAVMSKPVGKMVFVAGKFAGVASALALAFYLLALMLLMTVRMGVPTTVAFEVDIPVFLAQLLPLLFSIAFGVYCNYFYRSNFTAAAIRAGFILYTLAFLFLLFIGKEFNFEWIALSFAEAGAWPVALAALTIFFGMLILASVALAASTRVNVVANIMICLTIFFIGMISNYLFGREIDTEKVRWEPIEMAETVTLSGAITDENDEPVQGIHFFGDPGDALTGDNGRYEIIVREGGSGDIRPRKDGMRFRPESRSYSNIEEDKEEQNFRAIHLDDTLYLHIAGLWRQLTKLAYHVTPSLQLFWVGDQLMRPSPYIPVGYVLHAAAYGIIWSLGMVFLAAFLFEGRELV